MSTQRPLEHSQHVREAVWFDDHVSYWCGSRYISLRSTALYGMIYMKNSPGLGGLGLRGYDAQVYKTIGSVNVITKVWKSKQKLNNMPLHKVLLLLTH